jgi:hypothetical protein
MIHARFVWTRRGLAKFVAEVNACCETCHKQRLQAGKPAFLDVPIIQVHRGLLGLRYLVVVTMPASMDPLPKE